MIRAIVLQFVTKSFKFETSFSMVEREEVLLRLSTGAGVDAPSGEEGVGGGNIDSRRKAKYEEFRFSISEREAIGQVERERKKHMAYRWRSQTWERRGNIF
jgi:hypothetical protein